MKTRKKGFFNPLKVKELRRKMLLIIGVMFIIRLLNQIPTPGVNHDYLKQILGGSGAMGFMDLMTGGSLSSLSILALNISPYITASIVIELLSIVFKQLDEMKRDGKHGQEELKKITLYSAIGLSFIQALAMSVGFGRKGMLTHFTWYWVLIITLIWTASAGALAFVGNYMTEKKLCNGVSLILACNILSGVLDDLFSLWETAFTGHKTAQGILYISLLVVFIFLMTFFVVYLQTGKREIPVTNARKLNGRRIIMSRKKSTGENEFAVMRFTFILPENIVENKLNNAVINNIDYLKESIRQNGLRQPIDVLPEKNGTTYRIIGGHRRFAAIKQGIEEGYGWFSKGIPCVIQPHQIENTIDEQIVMYEENLSSRNYQDGNYLEGVKTLYMLYQEKSRNDEEFKGSALIRRLAEKLNVGTRQAYKTAFIATSAAPWITNAVEDRLLPIDVAAMISHLDDDKQKALHKIFNEHQMIPKEILNMYRKGFQKKQESSDDGSSQENISESGPQEVMEEPKEIQATSKEEEPGHPAVSEPETHIPVSEPVMHTQEVSESVPEASRQQMPVLEGVSKQPVATPGFHVPEPPKPSVPVDLAGQQTEEPVARPALQTEQYPKEDQSSTEQCPGEEKTQTVLEKSHEEEKAQAAARKQEIKDMVSLYDDSNFFGENDIEDPYDGYDNADYAGYDDPEEPDYEDDVEEERSVCTPVNYHVDTTDSALTALAWFSEMVDRNGASEQEMAYVDTIVKMLAKFYFPHFVKQGYVDGKMRDTVKEIVDMMSGLV